MKHFRTIGLFCCVALISATAERAFGHDHTAKAFQKQREIARVALLQAAEPAPRTDAGEMVCKLKIELLLGTPPRPIAGLVRVTNLNSGKAISFADEIHRDKNWYVLDP